MILRVCLYLEQMTHVTTSDEESCLVEGSTGITQEVSPLWPKRHQKGTTLSAGMKQHLPTWRGRRAGTASAVHRAPQASGVAGRWFVCAPLCCRQRTCPLLPAAPAVGLARWHLTQRLEQNEKVHLRPRSGREIPRRAVSIAGCDSSSSPKEMFQPET